MLCRIDRPFGQICVFHCRVISVARISPSTLPQMSLPSLPAVLLQTLMQFLCPAEIVALARCANWTMQCADTAVAWRECSGPPILISPRHDPCCSRLLRRAPLAIAWHPRCTAEDFVAFCSSVRVVAVQCLQTEVAAADRAFSDSSLQHVRHVTLRFRPSASLVRAIAALPHLFALNVLSAANEPVYAALSAGSFPHLMKLHVGQHPHPMHRTPADDRACILAVSQLPNPLRRLSLAVSFAEGEFTSLCSSPALARLEYLTLIGRPHTNWPVTNSEYAAGLAALRSLRQLTLSEVPTMLAQPLSMQLHHAPALTLLVIHRSGSGWMQPLLAPILTAAPALRCRLVFRSFNWDSDAEWYHVRTKLLPRLDHQFPGRVECVSEMPTQWIPPSHTKNKATAASTPALSSELSDLLGFNHTKPPRDWSFIETESSAMTKSTAATLPKSQE